jgi:hypothetical protein
MDTEDSKVITQSLDEFDSLYANGDHDIKKTGKKKLNCQSAYCWKIVI